MGQVQSYEYLWGTMRWRVLREKLEKLDFSDGDRRIAEIRAECDRQCQIIALRRVLRDQLISIIDACVVDGRFKCGAGEGCCAAGTSRRLRRSLVLCND